MINRDFGGSPEVTDQKKKSPRARISRTPRATRAIREMRARGEFFFGPWLQTILRFHVCSVSISQTTSHGKKPSLPAERSASSTKIRQRRPFRTRFECAFLFDNFAILPLPLILYCLQYPFSSITTRERQVGKRGSRFAGLRQRYGGKPSFLVREYLFPPKNQLYAKRVFHSRARRIRLRLGFAGWA